MKSVRLIIRFIVFVIVFVNVSPAVAQIDQEFWFAAPSIVQEHDPSSISLVIVAYDEDATIAIDQPAAGRTILASRLVPAGSMFTYSVKGVANYRQTVETPADGAAHANGLHIRSTAPITAYYTLSDPNSEVYTFKGSHGLGTHFVVPTQFRHRCGHNAYSSVEVVATDDNTTVDFITFVPTNMAAATSLLSPDTIRVTLQRGETYAIRSAAANTPAAQHLGGTIVVADKPIAVNTTDDSAEAGSDLDLIGEQLVPSTLAGNRYILPANNSANHEYATFFAVDDSVTVMMVAAGPGGLVDTTRLGVIYPGEHIEQRVDNLSSCLFYSEENAPFVAFHLTANENGNELSGTVLPSLNCSGSQSVSYAPTLSDGEAKVTILTHTENIGSFLVNGEADNGLSAADFWPVPGDSAWSVASCVNLTLAGGEASFTIENYDGVFHLGILDNGGGACSYGFFSNYGSISLYGMSQRDYYYEGDTLLLHVTGAEAFEHITWQGPNGPIAVDESSPLIYPLTAADAGMYIVSAEHRDGCEVTPDTFFVHIFPAIEDRTKHLCYGDSLRLRAGGVGPYTWYADGTPIAGQTSRTYKFMPEQSTTITIAESVTGVDMIPWPSAQVLDFSDADGWSSVTLYEEQFSHLILGAEYLWEVVAVAPSANSVAPKLQLYIDGQAAALAAIPNGATPTRIAVPFTAVNSYVKLRLVALSPRQSTSLSITDMSLSPTLAVEEHISVEVVGEFHPSIVGNDTICPGDSLTLSVDMTGSRYKWSTGDTTSTTIISSPGKYYVYVWQGFCYEMSEAFVVSECVLPDTIVPIDPDTIVPPAVDTCLNVIYQRWDDVLSVKNSANNGGYEFVAFQWLRNGLAIEGAVNSYIYVPGGLRMGDVYSVLLTHPDGTEEESCPYQVGISAAPQRQQAPDHRAEKVLIDGHIYIIRDGRTFTTDGLLMK